MTNDNNEYLSKLIAKITEKIKLGIRVQQIEKETKGQSTAGKKQSRKRATRGQQALTRVASLEHLSGSPMAQTKELH